MSLKRLKFEEREKDERLSKGYNINNNFFISW